MSAVADQMPPEVASTEKRVLVTACLWCDRVLLDDSWVAANEAIRRLRTYEAEQPPAFTHTICDSCFDHVQNRRRRES